MPHTRSINLPQQVRIPHLEMRAGLVKFAFLAYVPSSESLATGLRGFCRICGSSLTFGRPGQEEVAILSGTIDEDILRSETGTQLCLAKGHIWCGNAVKGVTDTMPGTLWKESDGSEKIKEN